MVKRKHLYFPPHQKAENCPLYSVVNLPNNLSFAWKQILFYSHYFFCAARENFVIFLFFICSFRKWQIRVFPSPSFTIDNPFSAVFPIWKFLFICFFHLYEEKFFFLISAVGWISHICAFMAFCRLHIFCLDIINWREIFAWKFVSCPDTNHHTTP